jgi:hypothetical protein
MSTKGYPAPLTWDRLLELAAQGHTRARQLVASVREHSEVDTTLIDRCLHQEVRIENLEAEASAATATLERVRATHAILDSVGYEDPVARNVVKAYSRALAGSSFTEGKLFQPEAHLAEPLIRETNENHEVIKENAPSMMAPTEQAGLTPIERMLSKSWSTQAGLRLDLAAANARITEAKAKYQIARQQRNAANARADAAETRAKDIEGHFEQCHEDWKREKNRADAAERVTADCHDVLKALKNERDQLAARVKELEISVQAARTVRDAAWEQRGTCSREERAVLKAIGDATIGNAERHFGPAKVLVWATEEHALCQAELANRAAKAKNK